MNRGWLRWVQARLEYFVLIGAMVIIASLIAWWTVFARRLIDQQSNVSKDLLEITARGDPQQLADGYAALDQRAERMLFMLTGESLVFLLALALCVVVLVLVARNRLMAKERMERMLSFTSHELKTPIAGVRALLQSLSLGSIPVDQQQKFLAAGVHECDRLEHLAETVLAYQRAVVKAGAEAQDVHPTQALLDEVIAHRARTSTPDAITINQTTPSHVWADADAFRVVLENLLDNARKYGGGKVELSATADSTRWTLEIRDHGQGFDPRDADRLFRPFERAKHEGVTHGSGLGLSISRTLARQMGGDLRAQSDGAGKGSRFMFELKLAPEAKRA